MASTATQSLTESYQASGFDMNRSLPFGTNPLLLVIDVCAAYLTPGSSLYAPDRFSNALEKAEELITVFRHLDLPIIFTKIVHNSPMDGGMWYRKAPSAIKNFAHDDPMGDFPPDSTICRPDPTRPSESILVKQYASAFFGSSLITVLNVLGVNTLVMCGFSTSGCVRATGVDALQYGFTPYVVRDACGDRHEAVHEANLFDLQAKYAEVATLEEMKFLLDNMNKKSKNAKY